MKKVRFIALFLAVCMVFSMLTFTALANDDKIIIHVDANARFAGDGSAAKPFKSIENAQAYIRTKDHRKKDVEVLVHGGTYNQELTITFTQEDSGSEAHPVTYRAAGDGEVRISSAVKLNHMDFKGISDKDILNRIPEEVRGKVGVLDLSGYNLDMSMFDVGARTSDPREPAMYPYLYFNGKKQDVARWPNAGFVKITSVVKPGALVGGTDKGVPGTWKYENLRPERWTNADKAIIRGYLGSEYAMDACKFGGVTPERKEIYTSTASIYGVKPGHRWYIENLIEEIDSPGEYYVDVNAQKLYFYPPYKMKATDTLEVSTHSKTYIKVDGASYIIFDGIGVSGNVDGNGYDIVNSDHITIRNTTLSNLHRGINLKNSKNTLIETCEFYDINTNAVYMVGGGDVETLTSSNNRVSNCHIYNWALGAWMLGNDAISVGRNSKNTSIGDVIENNIIHGQPYGAAIIYGGVENIIRYNELYSVSREAADAGVVYCGRYLREHGNVTCYNYIHSFAPLFDSRYDVKGIYWDDWQTGQIAHHNIIVPGSKKSASGNLYVGADGYYCENIIANSDVGVHAVDRKMKIQTTAYNSPNEGVSAALLEKYPEIAGYRAQLEKDNMYMLCKGSVVKNNLSANVNRNKIDQVHIDNGSIENNQLRNDYDMFVDPDNHDWRLKREAVKELGFPDTFINEDNFSMDMIGIQKDVWDIEKPATPFKLLYPTNGQTDVIRNMAYIKWEQARFADLYEYVVATDPELKNVVASGETLHTVVELPELNNNTVYYYKVYAKNLSKQLGNTWASEGVPYMFKTSAQDVLEKEFLNEEIANLKKMRSSIVVGDGVGMYKQEAVTAYDNVLANAQRIANKVTGSQDEIQETVAEIQAFMNGVSGYKHAGHNALDLKKSTWSTSSDAIAVTNSEGTIVLVDSVGGGGWAYINQRQPGYLIQHFKMKVKLNGYSMLSLKQNDPKIVSHNKAINNYAIVIKTDQIELQKYNPGAATTGVIATYPNEYIKEEQWVNVEFGCVDVPGGVNVIFKVDGNEIVNYLDTETPNFGDGYFVVYPGKEGAKFEFMAADPSTLPAGAVVVEGGTTQSNEAKTTYNADNKIAVKTGAFTDIDATTIDGSKVKVSSDANAKITYTVTDTEVAYKTYYYHKPIEGGDKNATISMVAYSPSAGGKTEVVKNVDFSQGEEGWVYLGTYECVSHAKTGDIIITVKGSGQGKLVAPVIATAKANKDLLEFNRTFYDYANNLLLMKIDSQKAFKATDELTIPDVAPYIENGRTMVPIRFVSEAFGAQVDWNADTQTATITSGDKVVAFTLGNKTYTANGELKESETEAKLVNGRTMIPLRATVEALGKKVMWYGDARLIFIADEIGFSEADTTKLQNAAKGFEKGFN